MNLSKGVSRGSEMSGEREKVKRYDEGGDDLAGMYEHEDGDWVAYEDCVALLRECEGLRDDLATMIGADIAADGVRDAARSLRADLDRLKRERDNWKAEAHRCAQNADHHRIQRDRAEVSAKDWSDRAAVAEAERDRLREEVRDLAKAWACSDPEGPGTQAEITANECAADLWALLEGPAPTTRGETKQ